MAIKLYSPVKRNIYLVRTPYCLIVKESKMLKGNQHGMSSQTSAVLERAESLLTWLSTHHLICIHKQLSLQTVMQETTEGSFLCLGDTATFTSCIIDEHSSRSRSLNCFSISEDLLYMF
jgi:hypothetical protein